MKYQEMMEEAEGNKQLRQLTAEYVKFDNAGTKVVGMLMGKNEVQGRLSDKSYTQYLFDTDDGLIKCALGSANDGEAGTLMQVGGIYSITFLGTESMGGGRRVNQFEVVGIMTEEEALVGGKDDIPPKEEPAKKPAKEDEK